MKRRDMLQLAAAGPLFGARSSSRPNIVLFIADDHGWTWRDVMGHLYVANS
jgi:hypothetical protein